MGAGFILQEFPKLLLFFWLAVLCFVAGAGHGKLAWRLLITSAVAAASGGIGLVAGTFVPMLILWLSGRAAEAEQSLPWISVGACLAAFMGAFVVTFRHLVWVKRREFARTGARHGVYAAGAALLVYVGYLLHGMIFPPH